MIDWYFGTHSWNRISLTGLILAPIAQGAVGTLTIAHMLGLPIGALVFWAFGWAAIGRWRALRRQWRQLDLQYG